MSFIFYCILGAFIILIIYTVLFHFNLILNDIGTFLTGSAAILVIIPGIWKYFKEQEIQEKNRKDGQFITLSERASSNEVLIKLNAISTFPIFADLSRNNAYKVNFKNSDEYLYNLHKINLYLKESIDIIINILFIEAQLNSRIKDEFKNAESHIIEIACVKALNEINQRTLKNLKVGNSYKPVSIIDLSNTILRGIQIPHVDFRNANLSSSDLAFVDLTGAKLSGINLNNVNLQSTVFSYSNLDKANLSNATISLSNFTNANLQGANLSNIHRIYRSDFAGANLIDTDFTDTEFEKSFIDLALINNIEKMSVYLKNQNLGYLDFENATLDDLKKYDIDESKKDKIFRIRQEIPEYWNN